MSVNVLNRPIFTWSIRWIKMSVDILNKRIFTCIISGIKNECKCIKQINFYLHHELNKRWV